MVSPLFKSLCTQSRSGNMNSTVYSDYSPSIQEGAAWKGFTTLLVILCTQLGTSHARPRYMDFPVFR